MTGLWPVPAPEPLSQLTPTTAWTLYQCGARVGFAQDPAIRPWVRPTERSALGSAVHTVHEQAWRGYADESPLGPTEWVKHAWEQAVERESARLADGLGACRATATAAVAGPQPDQGADSAPPRTSDHRAT